MFDDTDKVLAYWLPTRRLQRQAWVRVPPETLAPGDLIAAGVVRAVAWGGPLGIPAWRIAICDRVRPVWLAGEVLVSCRRGVAPAVAAMTDGIAATSNGVPDAREADRALAVAHARARAVTCR